MNIYTWDGPEGNVGDELNRWLWPRLFGPDFLRDQPDLLFLGIGSVLDRRHDAAPSKLVFGAGARGPDSVPDITAPGWDIAFVRGPRTAAALGLGPDRWISDPAILTPLVDPRFPARAPRPLPRRAAMKVGFIPYYATRRGFAEMMAHRAGFELIPVTLNPERFFSRLLDCDVVLTEAMHGAILADALGVPWIACRLSSAKIERDTHHFKWGDWAETLGLVPEIATLPYCGRQPASSWLEATYVFAMARLAARTARNLVDAEQWVLSDRAVLAERQEKMMSAVRSLAISRSRGAGAPATHLRGAGYMLNREMIKLHAFAQREGRHPASVTP